MNILAENIVKRRKELKMTQKEFAERLYISDKTVSRWETGNQIPDALMIPKIAEVLEISIEELYGVSHVEENSDDAIPSLRTDRVKREETVESGKVTLFKIALLVGVFLFLGLTTRTAYFVGYIPFYGTAIIGVYYAALVAYFCTCHALFRNTYKRKENAFLYEREHVKWLGMAFLAIDFCLVLWLPFLRKGFYIGENSHITLMIAIVVNLFLFLIVWIYNKRLIGIGKNPKMKGFYIITVLLVLGLVLSIYGIQLIKDMQLYIVENPGMEVKETMKSTAFVVEMLVGTLFIGAQSLFLKRFLGLWKGEE